MKWIRSRNKDGLRLIYAHPRWNIAIYGYETYKIERICRGWWIASWKKNYGHDQRHVTWIPGTFRSCFHTCQQHQAGLAMEALR